MVIAELKCEPLKLRFSLQYPEFSADGARAAGLLVAQPQARQAFDTAA